MKVLLAMLVFVGGGSIVFPQSLEYGKVYSNQQTSIILLKYRTDIPGVPPPKVQTQGIQVLVAVTDKTTSAATIYLTVTSSVDGKDAKETFEYTVRVIRSPVSPYQWVYFPMQSSDFAPNSVRVTSHSATLESIIAP